MVEAKAALPLRRAALGLPTGSVRAILTLMTVAFITIQTARGRPVSLLWFESLMIVLAHYFTSRRLLELSPELRERLTSEGMLVAEPNPLYLPRHSLRLIIIGAFIALAAYLYRDGRLLDPVALPLFIAVGSYFLGILFRAMMQLLRPHIDASRKTAILDDAKAILTLAALCMIIVLQLSDWENLIPFGARIEALPLALMLFYFGSR